MDIGDTALTFDFVVEADGMPDRDALDALTTGEEARDIAIGEITRQSRIDAGDVLRHAVEEIRPRRAQQCIDDRLVDFRRSKTGGERRNVFPGASLDLGAIARRMQAERRIESLAREIKLARNL